MKIKNILVTTDDSACARGAAAHGTALARAFDGTVYAVSAVDPSRFGGHAAGNAANLAERQEAHARDAAERAVERVADRAQAADVPAETAVERGSPYEVLRRRVRESGIDLVAMGTHGRTGLDRHLLGSVAERAMRTSSVPVLAVHGDEADLPAYGTVVVATDGSEHAARAAAVAVAIAGAFDATVHALHVDDGKGVDPTADVTARADAAGVANEAAVRDGTPSTAIVEYATEVGADLVAVGTHGRTGLDRYLVGSVAERVVRTSSVPVLTAYAGGGDGSV